MRPGLGPEEGEEMHVPEAPCFSVMGGSSQCCLPTTVTQGMSLQNCVSQTIVGRGSASGANMNQHQNPREKG